MIGEYILYRKFDADWLEVERCLNVLKRLAVDSVVKGSIGVYPYEWRSDKVLGHMAQLKWFVSAPRRFHEYLMKNEGVMTDFIIEMRGVSTERGSNINQSKTKILTVKSNIWLEFCIKPFKRFNEENCFFNISTGEFEMNQSTKMRLFRSLTFRQFTQLNRS